MNNLICIGEGSIMSNFLELVQEVILTFKLSTVNAALGIPGVKVVLLWLEVLLKGFKYTFMVIFAFNIFPVKTSYALSPNQLRIAPRLTVALLSLN